MLLSRKPLSYCTAETAEFRESRKCGFQRCGACAKPCRCWGSHSLTYFKFRILKRPLSSAPGEVWTAARYRTHRVTARGHTAVQDHRCGCANRKKHRLSPCGSRSVGDAGLKIGTASEARSSVRPRPRGGMATAAAPGHVLPAADLGDQAVAGAIRKSSSDLPFSTAVAICAGMRP